MSNPTEKSAVHHAPPPHTCAEHGTVRAEFAGVELTPMGVARCQEIGMAFTDCLNRVEGVLAEHPEAGRALAIVRTKLQEASSWAKRGACDAPGSATGARR